MKIKEITEGILDAIAAGSRKGISSDPYGTERIATPQERQDRLALAKLQKLQKQQAQQDWVQGAVEKSKDPKAGLGDKVAGWWAKKFDKSVSQPEQPQDQQQQQSQPQDQQQQPQNQQQPQGPKNDPNVTLKSKIDYLVKQGILQSGRITDDEKRYIDSVDVWVDTNKFAKEDPSTRFIKARRPHQSLFIASVQIPMSEWQRALGRSGEGLSGYVSFDLTPAGWWSSDFNAYINPNNQLDDLVTRYQKG